MHKSAKRKWSATVVAAAAAAIVVPIQRSLAAYPTTVYTASSSVGFDTTNFTSLTVGSPNSINPLVNLDGSLIAGTVTNNNSASGYPYSEVFALNLTNLSVSIIGLNDSNHTIVDSSTGAVNSPSLYIVSPTGTIVGSQASNALDSDMDGSTSPTGQDVFTSVNGAAPTVIPLPTAVLAGEAGSYSYTDPNTGTSHHSMEVSAGTYIPNSFGTNAIGQGGIIVGEVGRYQGTQQVGYDGFYYNPATGVTTAIGLTGGEYNNAGAYLTGTAGIAATGFTELVDSNGNRAGYDGWMYTPSAGNVQIGLVGGPYTYNSSGTVYELTQLFRTNAAGQIAGRSSQVSGAGDPLGSPTVDAWLYTPSATPGIASGFGTSGVGTYARLGLIAFPSGSTLGYTNQVAGSQAANFRYTNIQFLANNGNVVGQSDRFDSSGNLQGLAAWYYNGSTNVDISPAALNPADTIHAAVAGGAVYSTDYPTALNNTGMAAAYATRIAGTTTGAALLGQDAYIYDSNTGKEYFADPTDEAKLTNYEYSFIGTLGDAGYAVGFYNTYTGSTPGTETTTTIFLWSELGKLQPLYSFANTRATNNAALQTYVSSFQFGSDGELYGPNNYTAATSIVAYGLNVFWNNSLGTGNGQTWDTTSQNWTNGVIPLVYLDSAMVTFNDNNNGHYAVTLNTTVSPNAVTFNNNAGNYTLSGTGSIAGAGGLTKLGTASVTLATTNSYTGATNVSGGTLFLAAAGALPAGTNLTIGAGASVVASNLGNKYGLTVDSLSVFGKLDLNNNGLVVRGSSITAVTSLLQSGYNGGKWNGSSGIVSTAAAVNTSHLTALGVIINDTGANNGAATGTALYSTLDGAATADGDILVKYTYYGDANLDGQVDGSDYTRIDNGYLNKLTGWANGDFNYDGVVDGSDYTLIDNAFNTQGASLAAELASASARETAEIAVQGTASQVPEPDCAALLGTLSLLVRRRARTCGVKLSSSASTAMSRTSRSIGKLA